LWRTFPGKGLVGHGMLKKTHARLVAYVVAHMMVF
jgi:hypothetical protein